MGGECFAEGGTSDAPADSLSAPPRAFRPTLARDSRVPTRLMTRPFLRFGRPTARNARWSEPNRHSSITGAIIRGGHYPHRSETEGKAFRISNGHGNCLLA